MKRTISLLTFACLSFSSLSVHAEVTANAAVSSNYHWRGLTQTDDSAAVSGGLDYSNESGFYVGTWVSNVDFGDDTSHELDIYTGYKGKTDHFDYDVGYIYYAYPDATGDTDFGELYAELTWQWLSVKASHLLHAQNDSSTEEDMLYLELNASFTVLNDTELALHIGRSSGDTIQEWTSRDDTYMDYSISLSKSGFTFALLKTDLDNDDDLQVSVSYGVDFTL
jgi:uncharacterized protein (TIGR02001 family)